METMDDYKDELEASFRRINEGDIISGTVIDVNEEEVTLDLKYYAQGIIKVADLSNDPDFNVLEQVHKGDVIEATVVQKDDGAGNIVLSKKEANDILAWDKLKQMMEGEATVKVRIQESVPSGVVTYLLMLDNQKTYRIFENLFVNVVKYAMQGSRVYLEVRKKASLVEIILKNMSAEEIHISGDEITERFVRGDSSRNTEGSGLGLAIAKSFTEAQGGEFHVEVDGDLFKVVILF